MKQRFPCLQSGLNNLVATQSSSPTGPDGIRNRAFKTRPVKMNGHGVRCWNCDLLRFCGMKQVGYAKRSSAGCW
jgi:hypothetical protein